MRNPGAYRNGWPSLAAAMICLAALTIAGCSDDADPPDDVGCPDGIGPAGGSISVTDTTSDLHGVGITVAPLAWNQCYGVFPGYETTFTTPNFPDGIEGYAGWLSGSLRLEIGHSDAQGNFTAAPDSLELEITFPLRDLVCADDEIFAAWRYDDTVSRWRVVLPVAATDSTITVRTCHHRPLWTWGKISLYDVDFDLYLAPALAEAQGSGRWLEVQDELRSLYDSVITEDLSMNCANLIRVRDLFAAVRDARAEDVRAFQAGLGGVCGTCDVTTAQYFDEYVRYLSLNFEAWLIEMFFVENGPNLLIQAYGFMRMCETLDEIESLACDYECFFAHETAAFARAKSSYYVAYLVVLVIDHAIEAGWVDC
jgi:hypothetical protein